jgi:hypothetical protein
VYWWRAVKGGLKKVYCAMVAPDMGNHSIDGVRVVFDLHLFPQVHLIICMAIDTIIGCLGVFEICEAISDKVIFVIPAIR